MHFVNLNHKMISFPHNFKGFSFIFPENDCNHISFSPFEEDYMEEKATIK